MVRLLIKNPEENPSNKKYWSLEHPENYNSTEVVSSIFSLVNTTLSGEVF